MATHKIYFVQRRDGLVKIGTTTCLEQRIATLAKSHGPLRVLRVINGDARREGAIHHQFEEHREFGEWFRPLVVRWIGRIEEGDTVAVTKSDVRRAWVEGEAEICREATRLAVEMRKIRAGVAGVTLAEAGAQIIEEYGFPSAFFEHVAKGRIKTISAYGMRQLRIAAREEMKRAQAWLEDEIEREAGPAQAAAIRQGAAVAHHNGWRR